MTADPGCFGSRVRLREKADHMIVAGQILTAKRWLKYQLVNYLSALTKQQQFFKSQI